MVLISSPPREHLADIFRSAIEIKTLYVANMSSGIDWEALKRNESLCDMARLVSVFQSAIRAEH
jgi:hypothetical protein